MLSERGTVSVACRIPFTANLIVTAAKHRGIQ